MQRKNPPLTDEQKQIITNGHSQGMSVAAIARNANCSVKQAQYFLEKEGDVELAITPTSTKRYKKICALREKGLGYHAMAKKIGCSYETIKQTRRRHEGYVIQERPSLTPEQEQQVCVSYATGTPIQDVMLQFDICDTRMYDILFRHKIPLRKANPYIRVSDQLKQHVLDLVEQGVCATTITKQVGLASSTVYRIINRSKLK